MPNTIAYNLITKSGDILQLATQYISGIALHKPAYIEILRLTIDLILCDII